MIPNLEVYRQPHIELIFSTPPETAADTDSSRVVVGNVDMLKTTQVLRL